MATKAKRTTTKLMGTPKMPRASVSFPPELYATLERIAKEKKVSVAWVVREAVETYVSNQWPLFARTGQGQ
jgi:metal-responsive CopG/Arc/MetJ family transcriptional regulator